MLEGKKTADDSVIMEMLSANYGWTPDEIRGQPFSAIIDYVDILNAKKRIQDFQAKYGKRSRT